MGKRRSAGQPGDRANLGDGLQPRLGWLNYPPKTEPRHPRQLRIGGRKQDACRVGMGIVGIVSTAIRMETSTDVSKVQHLEH